MPVVKNIVKDSSSAVLDGTVTIELVIFDSGNSPLSFQGFVDIPADTTSDFTINIPASSSITNGIWSMTLRGNSDITDAYGVAVPTYYKVTESTQSVNRTYYISVPTSGGPYWTGNIGAFDPQTYSASANLAGLTDVDVSGVTNGQFLSYQSSSGKWIPASVTSSTGSWSPTASGITTAPATWTGIW